MTEADGEAIGRAARAIRAVHRHHDRAVPADLRALGASDRADAEPAAAVGDLPVPHHVDGARALGLLYEASLPDDERRAGAHFTPGAVAAGLATLVGLRSPEARTSAGRSPGGGLPGGPSAVAPPRVWDPACGGGAFLLAAADALVEAGHDPDRVVTEALWGTDVDPGAIAVTEAALAWWAAEHGVPEARPGPHLVVADALTTPPPPEVDVVLGNPPFHGQLAAGNVRTAARTAALRAVLGPAVAPYTDTAALFWLLAVRALAPGGRAALVLPLAVLSARDAAAVRAQVSEVAELTDLWVAAEPVFEAAVEVCAPVVRRPAGPPGPAHEPPVVRRWRGSGFARLPEAPPAGSTPWAPAATAPAVTEAAEGRADAATVAATVPPVDGGDAGAAGEAPPSAGSWAPLLLAALGVPEPVVRTGGRLGELVSAAAGFRDEYYGLVPHVRDLARGEPVPEGFGPLVTTGLIDVGTSAWGRRPVRFARRSFDAPVVDRAAVVAGGGRAAAWVTATTTPKVVVATQTRVGEAAVDVDGTWVAGTPVVVLRLRPRADAAAPGADAPGAEAAEAEASDPAAPEGEASEEATELVDRLWRVAAVVCSPVGSVAALAATAGSGRARNTIRPRVGTVVDLPLPVDAEAWAAGAVALRDRRRDAFVEAMAAAYAVADPAPLHDWWSPLAPW